MKKKLKMLRLETNQSCNSSVKQIVFLEFYFQKNKLYNHRFFDTGIKF